MKAPAVCQDCSGPCWPYAARCLVCSRKHRAAKWFCIDCGGPVWGAGVQRCLPCYKLARKRRQVDQGYLENFNPAAFRALLERDDVGWNVPELARRAGLHSVTLYRWLNGSRRPQRFEWRQVAAVLALEPCGHCGGTGTIDPTADDIDAVTQAFCFPAVGLPTAERSIFGAGWTLDRATWVLRVDSAEVHVTRQEARLIGALADGAGALIGAEHLAVALRQNGKVPGPHAVRTYLTRLRGKCVAAGLDLGRVIQGNHGRGYRAVMPSTQEAAS